MSKISPFLWFDTQAREAAELYVSTFAKSKILSGTTMSDTPSGKVEIIEAELFGQPFKMMSAGPLFTFNPSISFLVAYETKSEVDLAWKKLSEKGSTLMELGSYPFSDHYCWIMDRFGVSWQLMRMQRKPVGQRIVPTLMFVGDRCGKAEEAVAYYSSVFKGAVGDIMRYSEGDAPDEPGTVKHASFTLEGQPFAAMDSAREHAFGFNEAISFEVECADQAEIDHFWTMSADSSAEQCGWLKDKYGVSWQIVPAALGTLMQDGDAARVARVTRAFMAMKKFDIAALYKAYEGR